MLSDTAIRNAKPAAKPYKMTDEKGLHLLINAAGKYWRHDYRFDGKRKTLALGVYPDVTLSRARERRGAPLTGRRNRPRRTSQGGSRHERGARRQQF